MLAGMVVDFRLKSWGVHEAVERLLVSLKSRYSGRLKESNGEYSHISQS